MAHAEPVSMVECLDAFDLFCLGWLFGNFFIAVGLFAFDILISYG
jgi:hypothetical protein